MKYLFTLVLFIPLLSFSQVENEEQVYDVVGVSPQYPGGPSEMAKFIQENFEYPEEAKENGEQGTVWVEFIVYKDGLLRDVKIVKGVSESLDDECVRVVSAMPIWSPGEHAGKPVNVRYTIPIKARLGNTVEEKKKKKKLFNRN